MRLLTFISGRKVIVQKPIYDIGHVVFARMSYTVVHIFFVHDTKSQMCTLRSWFFKITGSKTQPEQKILTWSIFKALRMSPNARCNIDFKPSSLMLTLGLIVAFQKFEWNTSIKTWIQYFSWSMTCWRRGTICSSFNGPNRNRVQRDWIAGIIFDK